MTSFKSNMDEPHPIDRYVGNKIKTARKLRKMTQTDLAQTIGVSYQQIQKYEKGDNRVSASMMYMIAQAINVPLAYFYEGLERPNNKDIAEFDTQELNFIRKYRQLPADRRHAVNKIVNSLGAV